MFWDFPQEHSGLLGVLKRSNGENKTQQGICLPATNVLISAFVYRKFLYKGLISWLLIVNYCTSYFYLTSEQWTKILKNLWATKGKLPFIYQQHYSCRSLVYSSWYSKQSYCSQAPINTRCKDRLGHIAWNAVNSRISNIIP